jgi:hypothetical protein
VGFLEYPAGKTMAQAAADLIRAAEKTNASSMIFFTNYPVTTRKNRVEFLKNLKKSIGPNLYLSDVIHKGESIANLDVLRADFDYEDAAFNYQKLAEGGVLYSGIPIPVITRLLDNLGKFYTGKIGSPIWDKLIMKQLPRALEHIPGGKSINRALIYDYRGNLPMTDVYIKSMEEMQHNQAVGREYAIDVGRRLQDLPEESQLRMGEAIRGELDLKQLTPEEGRLAIEAVRVMSELGRQAVYVGLLGEETYFKNVGRYMPRLYTSKEYQTLLTRFGLANPTRLDLSRFKRRMDIPEEIRAEMGEILTPGYPIAKGIAQLTHDIEMARFFNGIADVEEWSWTKKLPKEYVDEIRADLKEAIRQNRADKIPIEQIVQLVQEAHPEANIFVKPDAIGRNRIVIENGKPIPEGFKELPKNKRLGRLSESYVHPEIFNDLSDAINVMTEGERALQKGLSAWKQSKVTWSPKTHVRNIMSNSVLAHMGGFNMVWQPYYLYRAIGEMVRKDSELWKLAKQEEVLKGTFVNTELRQLFDELPEINGKMTPLEVPKAIGVMQKTWDAFKKANAKVGDIYQAEEQWFKMAMFMFEIEQNGLSPAAAARQAQKWCLDYSRITRFMRKYRQSLFGAPFATFTFLSLPRMAEAAIKTPWRYALPAAMVYAIGAAASNLIGDDEETRKAKLKLRPEYMNTKNFMGIPNFVRWPFVDEYGREYYLNLTYILPWGDIAEGGDFMGIPGALVPFGHPVSKEATQQIMNWDTFRGRKIVEEKDLAGRSDFGKMLEAAKIRSAHAAQTFGPTLALDVVKGIEAFRQEPQGRFGRVRPLGIVAADTFLGIKLYPVDYAEVMQRHINKLDPKKGRIAADLLADIKGLAVKKVAFEKRGMNGKKYQDAIDSKIDQMIGLGDELKEYAEAYKKVMRK